MTMIYTSTIAYENPWATANHPKVMRFSSRIKPPIICLHQNPENSTIQNLKAPKIKLKDAILVNPTQVVYRRQVLKRNKANAVERRRGLTKLGSQQMMILCGFGYWVQGFRCFPWLALNFHMANNLSMHPSVLQFVQHSGNLPMVAKPVYGLLSDALYIGGAHRIPYVSVGVGGFSGIGLASLLGVTGGYYSSLPLGILVQFVAAFLPLGWIHHLPISEPVVGKERKKSLSRRSQKSRRVGRVSYESIYIYRRERESEAEI